MKQNFLNKSIISLIFIKMFLIIPFGVLYSSLILILADYYHLKDTAAIQLTTSFLIYAGIMRMIAGFLGGNYFSYCNLLAMSALLLLFGSSLLILPLTFYWGVSLLVLGCGFTISVNCLLTDIFHSDLHQREAAFLWNYSGMNVGYIISFFLSGFFHLHHHYISMFIVSGFASIVALILIYLHRQHLKDTNTKYKKLSLENQRNVSKKGWVIIVFLVFILYFCLKYTHTSQLLVFMIGLGMVFYTYFIAKRQDNPQDKNNLFLFMFLWIPALIFWSLYNLTPLILTLFIERNVDRNFFSIIIAPQWFQVVSTLIIVIGGPFLCALFSYLRKQGKQITVFKQFLFALLFISLSFLLLKVGIYFSNSHGYINLLWIVIFFILQSIAELLIAPIGFAMIGQLVPNSLQGIMMGQWMMLISIGTACSGLISQHFLKLITHP